MSRRRPEGSATPWSTRRGDLCGSCHLLLDCGIVQRAELNRGRGTSLTRRPGATETSRRRGCAAPRPRPRFARLECADESGYKQIHDPACLYPDSPAHSERPAEGRPADATGAALRFPPLLRASVLRLVPLPPSPPPLRLCSSVSVPPSPYLARRATYTRSQAGDEREPSIHESFQRVQKTTQTGDPT